MGLFLKEKECYLGVSLGFNSSAALCDSKGRLLKAISEERLTRVKNTKRIPYNAVQAVLYNSNCILNGTLVYSHYEDLDKAYFSKYEPDYNYRDSVSPEQNLLLFLGIDDLYSIQRVDHHKAHAYSIFPYYKVPKNSIIMTADGYGDGLSATIRFAYGETLGSYEMSSSLGLPYQFVTGSLGLKMHQHEGKVTGLAAYGNREEAIALRKMLELYLQKHRYSLNTFDAFKNLMFEFCKKQLNDRKPEEIIVSEKDRDITTLCLAIQLYVEKKVIEMLKLIPEQNKYHLFLAGGLFANVRLNSYIAVRTNFKTVNVAPPMGDEGTAIGALLSTFNAKRLPKGKFKNIFSGIDVSFNSNLVKYDKVKRLDDLLYTIIRNENIMAKRLAVALANGDIVHVRKGKSEFGPRALGNSSTFYQPINPDGTKFLNKALGRSEYMPYAPIVLKDDVDKVFYVDRIEKKLLKSCQYMTAILAMKPEYAAVYKGAVHVDGTARPQILYDKHSFAYKLLKEYKKITGNMLLINTSWNIHNNPTVALASDSMLTWMESDYCGRYMVIGNLLYFTKWS